MAVSHACRLTTRSTPSTRVAGDVADLEPQPFGTEAAGKCLAVGDHVLLQVEADDIDLAPVHGREQVVQRERQIGLAGAEVDHP